MTYSISKPWYRYNKGNKCLETGRLELKKFQPFIVKDSILLYFMFITKSNVVAENRQT